MSLSLLFKDELQGFYKSKVMLILWIGLPAMTIILHLVRPGAEGIPLTALSALLVSSIGGTLASVMLAVSIINEKEKHVYDLFLVRPIKRRDILISKFLAVYVCITIASLLALICGLIIDFIWFEGVPKAVLTGTLESLGLRLSMMAISSSAGILIGVLAPSVLVGAILVIYGANQISIIPSLPTLTNMSHQLLFTVLLGAVLSIFILGLSVLLFNKKQF
ncbi:hypothetical protein AKJ50_02325 [candidate division MSBL1 archaeon SCGC-AAA382A13]|uniref:ABC-2 type transporter domain-containing protein n=1 Tax=candidate division MSBL1 archaeon SCGC-AAA382A13 TaxID=1698279 RepID=A0A133VDL3_9EURY|nr:hypothetical protein AKJ50_02325 [candidate division MSBL1 archaeon SCGC-AAA382A13]